MKFNSEKEDDYEKVLRIVKCLCVLIDSVIARQNLNISTFQIIKDYKEFDDACVFIRNDLINIPEEQIMELQSKLEIIEYIEKYRDKIRRLEQMKAFW